MRRGSIAGGLALVAFAVAGLAWVGLELVQPGSGFEDTDDPAVSLAFLRASPEVYAQAGLALLVAAVGLLVGALAVADVLIARAPTGRPTRRPLLAIRLTVVLGVLAAGAMLMHGVLRMSVQPLLHIDGLARSWGESGYVVLQLVGVHGFAQAGLLVASAWVALVGVVGWRTGTLPRPLCALAVLPAFRVIALVGPLDVGASIPEQSWLLLMASIPAIFLWCLLLGLLLVWRAVAASRAGVRLASAPVEAA